MRVRSLKLPYFPRGAALASLALWPVCAQTVIPFKTRAFDPLTGPASQAAGESLRRSRPVHFLIQFEAPPDAEMLRTLARRHVRVLRALPSQTLAVSMNDGTDLEGLGVRWSGPIPGADKLSPALSEAPPAAYLAIFHPDVPAEAALSLLDAAGLLRIDHPDLLAGQFLVTGTAQAVESLAAEDEVAYILPASVDLVAGVRLAACAGASTEIGLMAEYVAAGTGWPKVGNTVELAYAFASLTPKLPESTVRSEVARALAEWARYAPLRFTATQDPGAKRTIAILFAAGAHGDNSPFDGPGRTMAHTYYPAPPNSEPVAGDMHLDGEEPWQPGGTADLFTVALHEAGHALGLGHSDRPGAVMYPYYRMVSGLAVDDIAGIRQLYGDGSTPVAPPVTPPVAPPVTPPVTPPPTPTPTTPTTPTPPTTPTTPNNPAATDTTAPTLKIVTPSFTILNTSASTVTFQGTASDNVGVSTVTWSNSSGRSGAASGTSNWTAANVPLLVGNNTVTVRATDAAGNSSWRAVTVVRR
jgi:hypothetical protein